MKPKDLITEAKKEIEKIVNSSNTPPSTVIARYVAAIAVNFTDWIGKSTPWVRHENAYHALVDNLRCESEQDHVGMLIRFAELSNAMPSKEDYAFTAKEVESVRKLFSTSATAGLKGVTLCAVLENTSEIFIPDLANKAKVCGCTDFTYTDVHGEADREHSEAFLSATEAEVTMGYENPNVMVQEAIGAAVNLIRKIYS